MMEDKLTHDERVRLEAMSQANLARLSMTDDELIDTAAKIEDFVRNGKKEQS